MTGTIVINLTLQQKNTCNVFTKSRIVIAIKCVDPGIFAYWLNDLDNSLQLSMGLFLHMCLTHSNMCELLLLLPSNVFKKKTVPKTAI